MMEAEVNNTLATGKDPITVGDMTIQFLVEGADSDGSVSVFRCDLPAATRLPVAHSHDRFDETIYGLSGTTTWTVNGVANEVRTGEALLIPRGSVHSFAVTGDEDASILCVASPGLFGPDYFRDVAAVVDAAGDGPPDVAGLVAVMKRHGLTPVR
jgi:quercetin dioxygenase-like cupin family protein